MRIMLSMTRSYLKDTLHEKNLLANTALFYNFQCIRTIQTSFRNTKVVLTLVFI